MSCFPSFLIYKYMCIVSVFSQFHKNSFASPQSKIIQKQIVVNVCVCMCIWKTKCFVVPWILFSSECFQLCMFDLKMKRREIKNDRDKCLNSGEICSITLKGRKICQFYELIQIIFKITAWTHWKLQIDILCGIVLEEKKNSIFFVCFCLLHWCGLQLKIHQNILETHSTTTTTI